MVASGTPRTTRSMKGSEFRVFRSHTLHFRRPAAHKYRDFKLKASFNTSWLWVKGGVCL